MEIRLEQLVVRLGAKDIVSENGEIEDDYRIDYLREHIKAMRDAVNLDGVDLIIYFRNKIVHPSRKRNRATLHVEDMWNIIQIAIRYVELVILHLINYKGEYSNRLKERSYGEVELVPWNFLSNGVDWSGAKASRWRHEQSKFFIYCYIKSLLMANLI